MRRRLAALAAFAAVIGADACGGIDKILEGNPLLIKLNFSADSGSLMIPQGSAKSLRLRVTPTGDVLKGAISVSVERAPLGMTVTVDSVEADGITTTARVRIEVGDLAELGPQEVRVAAKAPHANDGLTIIRVAVVPPATLGLAMSKQALTIARGGLAPITARFTRTSFPLAVRLGLDGAPAGMTTTFDTAGSRNDSASASIVVAPDVNAGVYQINVRATGYGVSDQLAPLTVTVTNDPIQLIAGDSVAAPQAASSALDFVINRGAGVGAVTLSVENLPAGVSASFSKTTTSDPAATITFAPAGTVAAGAYSATIRASAAGFPDATATVPLIVLDASVAVTLTPGNFEVLQGQNTAINVGLTRTRFVGAVGLAVAGLPAGVTATPQPASVLSNAATILFSASASAVAGVYDVTVTATPAGLGASKIQSAPVKLTVRAVPAGANVVLDWTGCAMPQWIASQNGASNTAWSRVTPVGSQAGFLVNQGRGGYAWFDGATLNVRFALQSELTAQPILMCPPPDSTGTKSITGIGVHTNVAEVWTYSLGGGKGTSSTTTPAFTIFGVRDGTHDLVASGFSASGQRLLLRRDLDLPNGAALDPVDLTSTEGFNVLQRTMTFSIALIAGEQLAYSYNYLTTPACDENRLADGVSTTQPNYNGFPDNVQRATDFHEFVVSATSAFGTRTMSIAFHSAANRTMVVPSLPTNPVVSAVANAPYVRLQTTIGAIPTSYNSSASLIYKYGSQTVSISGTPGYTGFSNITLQMPDFSAVSGFQTSFAIPNNASGFWRLALSGASIAGSRCAEGRSTFAFIRSGAF